ncbi:glycosyltransferase [Mucilaginibacter terrenus]|uniref:Glycosyltransferase n=1 Tax=Mucilaginibacter terrenus TaxID=2482727 RepID=A0A3E2NPF3_9SPHI|nr:glycosyltransferase [Mucilaginibacter terrenus]RFZ82770.1 glycosyltransferase [Mucilaginibacter terrenus]
MSSSSLNITILGLSITSSWGNGHATTFRALVKELNAAGHKVTFLERDVPWYASNRDLANPDFCKVILYKDITELREQHADIVQSADLVIVGSYVPEGVEVGKWACNVANGITAFYDIDTPVTLAKLDRNDYEYLSPEVIPMYDLYLSFTGGPTLTLLEQKYGSPCARALYCSVDPSLYYPENVDIEYDLGYLGTYSDDRQPPLERLLFDAAKGWSNGRFVVAGPQYPQSVEWPANVRYINHLPPAEHRDFYNAQRFTLNITRADMIKAGYSPSVRLFEAAACGVPIISDYWDGLDSIFELGTEILVSYSGEETLAFLRNTPEDELRAIGERARQKILSKHTARHRAEELVGYYFEVKKTAATRHTS